MENASKALLMAAGVLIGILILSLAVYLFVTFGSASAEVHKQNEENQINQFNSQFTSYVGKEGITIYDVVTIANLATENNINYEYPKRISVTEGKDSYISVQFINTNIATYNHKYIENGFNSTNATKINYDDLIAKDLENMNYNTDSDISDLTQYECKVLISSYTKKVYKVTFSKK